MTKNQEKLVQKSLDSRTNWEEVLESINLNKFTEDYKNYIIKIKEEGYLIKKEDTEIFLFENKKKLNIYLDSTIIILKQLKFMQL